MRDLEQHTLMALEDTLAGQVAVIALEGRYESARSKPVTFSGVQVTMNKVAMTEKATAKIAVRTGLTTSDEQAVQFTAEFTASGDDGKEVPVTIKGTSTTRTTFTTGEAATPKPVPNAPVMPGLQVPRHARSHPRLGAFRARRCWLRCAVRLPSPCDRGALSICSVRACWCTASSRYRIRSSCRRRP